MSADLLDLFETLYAAAGDLRRAGDAARIAYSNETTPEPEALAAARAAAERAIAAIDEVTI